jgi:hypothetical protein
VTLAAGTAAALGGSWLSTNPAGGPGVIAGMRSLTILTVLGGLLVVASPASAFTAAEPKTLACELIVYNGHAGLGANQIVTDNNDPDTMRGR